MISRSDGRPASLLSHGPSWPNSIAECRQLTVHHSHQVPSQMREIFAAQLGLPLSNVRVVAPDVGGAFGMKLSAYPDEMAVAAIAVLLGTAGQVLRRPPGVLCQRQPRPRSQGSRPLWPSIPTDI